MIPFQRSGLSALVTGFAIFGVGFISMLLATLAYLIEISGVLQPHLAKIDLDAMPLTQWQTLQNVAGQNSNNYVRALRYENGKWQSEMGTRQDFLSSQPSAVTPVAVPQADQDKPIISPEAATNPLAPPVFQQNAVPPSASTPPQGALNHPENLTTSNPTGSLLPPPAGTSP